MQNTFVYLLWQAVEPLSFDVLFCNTQGDCLRFEKKPAVGMSKKRRKKN